MPLLGRSYLTAFAIEAFVAATSAVLAVVITKYFERLDWDNLKIMTLLSVATSTFVVLVVVHIAFGGYGGAMIDTTTKRERAGLGALVVR